MASTIAPLSVINTYGGIDELKSRANVTGTGSDGALWGALHSSSRAVDAFCNRRFFSLHATRLFDVSDPKGFVVPDLISVTALIEDADQDRVFELIRSSDDYLLEPANASPGQPWGRPHSRVVADPVGARPSFTLGRSTMQLEGDWGYRSEVIDSGAILNVGGPLAASTTVITVDDGTKVAAGQTLLVESEQWFVRLVSGNDLTVIRGVNGTTAVSHVDGLGVSFFAYPPQVVEATLLSAARSWKRKDTPYGPAAGVVGFGAVRITAGQDPDIARMLSPLRRLPLGVGV